MELPIKSTQMPLESFDYTTGIVKIEEAGDGTFTFVISKKSKQLYNTTVHNIERNFLIKNNISSQLICESDDYMYYQILWSDTGYQEYLNNSKSIN